MVRRARPRDTRRSHTMAKTELTAEEKAELARIKRIEKLEKTEADLIARYPDAKIVPDSLLPSEESDPNGPFAGKQTIEIVCCDCGAIRQIATQDLFQVRRCVPCTKLRQKANKAAKRAAKPENVEAAARRAEAKAARERVKAEKAAKRAEKLKADLAKLEAAAA